MRTRKATQAQSVMTIRSLDYVFRPPSGCDHRANEESAIGEALLNLGLGYPQINAVKMQDLIQAREALARGT